MNLQRTGLAAVAALALTVSLALPARGQPVKPAAENEFGVRRMEIWNGPVRTVHYFMQGSSPGEEATLRDLARAENDLASADEVQGLRRLYLKNERLLANRRGQVNPLLYGYSSEYAAGLIPGVVTGGFGYGGFAGYPYGSAYGIGGFGNVGSGFAYPGIGAAIGNVNNSLANGVGNEGVMKNELARGLAEAATPEAIARATRAYDTAVARVGESQRLHVALGYPKAEGTPVKEERWVGGQVTVTTKDGKTFDGKLVREEPEWITVETATEDVSLRKSEVTRIVRPKQDMKPEGQ